MSANATPASEQPQTHRGHAALMDEVYRYQRHIYDVTRKFYLFGRDRLIADLKAQEGERIIEIGCGTARNLIRIATVYPGVRLFGLDASKEMLRSASESVERAGLSGRIALAHGLAEEMTPELFGESDLFDRAIFSYSLSMIPDWRGALDAAASALKPDGTIHVVDFGDLERFWPPAARGMRAWLRRFHVAPRDALLKSLEKMDRERISLRVLPGRYAFVLTAGRAAFSELGRTERSA